MIVLLYAPPHCDHRANNNNNNNNDNSNNDDGHVHS